MHFPYHHNITWRYQWLGRCLCLLVLICLAADPAPVRTPEVVDENHASILLPGDGSSVLSPITVSASLDVADAQAVFLELVAKNGSVLSRKLYFSQACEESDIQPDVIDGPTIICNNRHVDVDTELYFGITEKEQLARLQIYIQDSKQRKRALDSVELNLLSSGKADLRPQAENQARVVLLQPEKDKNSKANPLAVIGQAEITNILPLSIVLMSDNGKVLSSRMAKVTADTSVEIPDYGVFRVNMNTKIKAPVGSILTISQPDEVIPGYRYILSRRIELEP